MRVKVMYVLEPTQAWKDFKALPKPAQKLDHNGQPMWEKWPQVGERPRPILDFPVLPDNVKPFRIIYQANANTLTDLYQ